MATGSVIEDRKKEKNNDWGFWMNWVARCVQIALLFSISLWLSKISEQVGAILYIIGVK